MAKIKTKTKKDSKNSLKSLKEKIKTLENDLLKESEEVKRVSEKNIRLLAEFDNYKRRTQKERSDLLKYEGQSLAKSLLPILDDLNRSENFKSINSFLRIFYKDSRLLYFGILGDNQKGMAYNPKDWLK